MLVSADFESYLQYFKDFSDSKGLFHLYGGIELGISHATAKEGFSYPFVWLEQPEIVSDENDMTQINEIYYGGISVISSAPLDDHAAQVQAEIVAIRWVYELQRKMRLDSRAKGTIHCTLKNMKKNAVDRGWAGNHHGWRLQFELHLTANGLLS